MTDDVDPGWDALVTAALLGTTRRPVGVPALAATANPALAGALTQLPDGDPAVVLLDAAALTVTQQRAGRRPYSAMGLPRVEPAAPDARAVVGAAAVLRLDDLLHRADADLLAEWLRAVIALGRRVPASRVVRVLTAVATVPELRELAIEAGGERAAWLVEQWRVAGHPPGSGEPRSGALGSGPPGSGEPRSGADSLGPVEPDGDAAWRTGSGPRRLAWLAALRRRDPDAARQVLVEGWSAEPPAERAAFVAVLAEHLALADEPFLETCLDDKRAETRTAAARLLARLSGSALSQRMTARATAAVRLRVLGRIEVGPLPLRDAAAARDGVPGYRGQGGEGRWVLVHVLAATPLSTWTDAFAATAADVVAMPIEGDWGPVLREGWARAAVVGRDSDWARALLGHEVAAAPGSAGLPHDGVAALVAVLPADVRAALAAGLLAAGVSARQGERWLLLDVLLHRCAAPWPADLADAVLAWLGRVRPDEVVHISRGLVRLAGRRLPPDRAAALLALTARRGPDLLTPMLTEAAELLAYRHDLFEELR